MGGLDLVVNGIIDPVIPGDDLHPDRFVHGLVDDRRRLHRNRPAFGPSDGLRLDAPVGVGHNDLKLFENVLALASPVNDDDVRLIGGRVPRHREDRGKVGRRGHRRLGLHGVHRSRDRGDWGCYGGSYRRFRSWGRRWSRAGCSGATCPEHQEEDEGYCGYYQPGFHEARVVIVSYLRIVAGGVGVNGSLNPGDRHGTPPTAA